MTPFLSVLRMYITHDCINCLQQHYTTSKHHIVPSFSFLENMMGRNTKINAIFDHQQQTVVAGRKQKLLILKFLMIM